ncbi:MAG: glycosyltransferase family 2 protein, partial [Minisyncoccia bacterium]
DTHMPEKWIDVLEDTFNKNPNCACLSGPYIYYDVSKFKQLLVKLYWYLGMPLYALIGYMVIGGNFVIQRKVLDKMNGFDTNIKFYGEDTDIGRRASKFGKIVFNPRFYMYTSARRLNGQGFFSTGYTYVINFFSEVFLHKPITEEYKDIR